MSDQMKKGDFLAALADLLEQANVQLEGDDRGYVILKSPGEWSVRLLSFNPENLRDMSF